MPRPPARRRQFAPAPARGQPERVTTAYNERNIVDLALKLKDKPVGRVPSNSDDSDELVTKAVTTRNRRGVARREIFASGGLGKGDEPASPHNRKRTSDSLKEPNEALHGLTGKRRRVERQSSENAVSIQNGRRTKSPTSKLASNKGRNQLQRPPTVRATLLGAEPPNENGLRDQSPPVVERSILADIKRRPRQASILPNANIPGEDNLDHLSDFDDLDDLEPNDVSTPFDSRTRSINGRPSAALSSTYRQRIGSNIPPTPAIAQRKTSSKQVTQGQNINDRRPEHSINPSRSFQPLLQRQEDGDIFGPPQSSSPLRSSSQSSPPPAQISLQKNSAQSIGLTIKKASQAHNNSNLSPPKQLKAPSTQSLQNLMPKPRKGRRLRQTKPKDDYDIPSDFSSGYTDDDVIASPPPDDSSFFESSKRQHKSRKSTKTSSNSKFPPKPQRNISKDSTTTIRNTITKRMPSKEAPRTGKSIKQSRKQSTPPPPNLPLSPVHPALSLSLGRGLNAKSLSPLQPRQHNLTASTYGNGNASSRSLHLRRGSDKENQLVDGKSAAADGSAFSSSPLSMLETTPEAAGGAERRQRSGPGNQENVLDAEMSAIRRKFADVDDWGLEFEDVSGGGGSSPRDRWR